MTETKARRLGEALLKRLKGKGWKLHVWETLGWHYEVSTCGLTITGSHYPSEKLTYWAMLNWDGKGSHGAIDLKVDFRSSDPNKVVQAALEVARKRMNQMRRLHRRFSQNFVNAGLLKEKTDKKRTVSMP